MVDLIRRTLMVGVGAVSLTRDRVEQFVNDAIARGEISSEQGKSLMDEMTVRAEQQQHRMETFVRQQVDRALDMAGLSSRTEVARLESRLDSLETRIRDLSARLSLSQSAFSSTGAPGIASVSPITVESYSSESSIPEGLEGE